MRIKPMLNSEYVPISELGWESNLCLTANSYVPITCKLGNSVAPQVIQSEYRLTCTE